LDTLNRSLRELKRERRRHRGADSERDVGTSIRDRRADELRVLAAAVKTGALSQQDARVIFAVRIEHCSLAEVAADEDVAYNVLRVRLQRAERRLLLHLGHAAVPKRRANRPLSSARAIGAERAGRIGPNRSREGR